MIKISELKKGLRVRAFAYRPNEIGTIIGFNGINWEIKWDNGGDHYKEWSPGNIIAWCEIYIPDDLS